MDEERIEAGDRAASDELGLTTPKSVSRRPAIVKKVKKGRLPRQEVLSTLDRDAMAGNHPAMPSPGRIYRRTAAGRKAWDSQDSNVPLEYRKVLGIISVEVHSDELRARLALHSKAGMLELLAELELLGLIESEPEAAGQNLDFTSDLNLSDIIAAARQKQELDFTIGLNLSEIMAAARKKPA